MSEQDEVKGTGTGSRRARLRERIGRRAWVRSAALVGSGLVAGGILAGAVTASAADEDGRDTGTSTSREDGRGGHGGHGGRSGPGGPGGPGGDGGPGAGEEALTGDTAAQVEEAVLAEYPDAEIERLETDADGVYEAHIVTADGEELTVELDEEYAVTGTEDR